MTRKNKQQEETLLSEDEVKRVWDFYQFATTFSNSNVGLNPILNPMLVNQRMQDITLNPVVAEQSQLDSAMKDPKNSETILSGVSEHFEIASQPYKRLIAYLGNMLSFDFTLTPLNAEKADYGTFRYKEDRRAVDDFLDKFDYKREFRIAVMEMLRNDTFFCSHRFDSDKYVLQELPASPTYTKITGRWPHGLLFSINMYFFTLPGVDLTMFDPFFAKAYKGLFTGKDGRSLPLYTPGLPPDSRGMSSWIYWQDVPVDVGWAFKMTPELATRMPYFVGLFNDLILQPLMRNLQKNVNMSAASRLLVGEVPFLKDAGAKVADAIAMTPETLAKFLQLVSSALTSSIKTAAAPLSNMQGINFPSENALYPTYLKNMLSASGVNTSLIFTSEARPNILESHLSLNTDEQLMTALYPQFASFMNYHINKRTKKFKWNLEFEGTNFFTNREERLNAQKELIGMGIVLPQKIAAAVGMKPQDMMRQMEEAKALGFVDSLTPISMAEEKLKASLEGGKEGRPEKKDSSLSDGGAETRETGGNVGRGGLEKSK